MRICITAALFAFAVSACGPLSADTYFISWHAIRSGGGLAAGGPYRLNCSVGQPTAGFVNSASLLHWIGFWAGDMPTPTVAPTLHAAKQMEDGTFVSIAGKIAASGQGDFDLFFYVQEDNRSSGIRVNVPASQISGLVRGKVVNVIGTLGTTPEGERQLTGPIVIIVSSDDTLASLGMPNRSVGGGDWGIPPEGQYGVLGGAGLNNVGLLIMTWGKVTEKGAGYLLITDGSGDAIRVSTAGLCTIPDVDDYIIVIGISSLYKPGADRLRLILPRDDADIGRP